MRTSQQLEDIREVMTTPSGRRLMHDLVYNVCDVEGGTFFEKVHDGVCQTQHQNLREGQRDVGITFMQLFKSDPTVTVLWVQAKEEALAQVSDELNVLITKSLKRRK